jgi:hypothetical protein
MEHREELKKAQVLEMEECGGIHEKSGLEGEREQSDAMMVNVGVCE